MQSVNLNAATPKAQTGPKPCSRKLPCQAPLAEAPLKAFPALTQKACFRSAPPLRKPRSNSLLSMLFFCKKTPSSPGVVARASGLRSFEVDSAQTWLGQGFQSLFTQISDSACFLSVAITLGRPKCCCFKPEGEIQTAKTTVDLHLTW